MQPGLRRRPPTIHTHRPAVPRLPLLLALALSWLGAAALWACTAWPLLRQGKDERVTAGSALAGAALLASAALGVHTQRSVSGRLAALRDWARVLATRELPGAAERMAAGRPLEVARLVPGPHLGDDELGRAAAEVYAAQRAALDLAAQQYAARENVRAVFLSLARRLQPLLHQQLGVLDVMERDHEDPDLLHQLFAVDHLSTRLRRHAENLVILGGARPPRQWRYAVPLMDVVRSAVSETAEYTRVEVEKLPNGTVCGHAVSDVVHLLAELLENGCTFSPPHTRVTISGEEVSHGLVLEIEDRGLGMSDEQYRRLNATLSAPARLTGDTGDTAAELGTDGRLGMFVVAGLAQRHSVDVELRRSPYGGTRVIVLLPRGIAAGSDGLPQCQPPMPGPGPDAAGSALDGPERAEDLRDPGDPGDPGSSGDLADLADLADLGVHVAVAAQLVGLAVRAAPVAVHGVPVVALFADRRVHHLVATLLVGGAVVVAPVPVDQVAVVAGLARLHHPVAALADDADRLAGRALSTRGADQARVVAQLALRLHARRQREREGPEDHPEPD